MEDYYLLILNLASQLRRHLTQFLDDFFWYIEWIPQHCEPSFSACDGRSLHGTECYSHFLPVYSTTEEQVENGRSGTSVLRKASSAICQRSCCRFSYPLNGCRLAKRLALHCWELCNISFREIHVIIRGLLCRLRITLQGSSEDIGWLQRTDGLPPVRDGTDRFKEILHDVRNGAHCLPNTVVYLFIPGLFSNHSPLYFVNTKRFFSKMGLTCHIAKIHSEASVESNAWVLKQYIEELYWGSGKQVLLLGHSKGGIDAAAALSLYWPDLKGKVAGLALVQSPYGGSPVASDILREGQIADKEARKIMEFVVCKLIKGDMRALEDLTYDKRKDFISKHKLPVEEVPLISFHTEASAAPTVLATLSRIAHAELPWLPLPRLLFNSDGAESMLASRKVPVVMPLSAAMALSAVHLRLRYGERSDGLVTRRDAEAPGSVAVRLERKLDHAWLVHSTLTKGKAEADASEICEALLALLVETGRTAPAHP